MVEPQSQPALASSMDLASFGTPVRSPRLDQQGWLRWTCDTGAAISAFLRAGTTEYGYGVTFQGLKAKVHKILISASKVHNEGHAAVVDSNGGYIILYNRTRHIPQIVQSEIVSELGAIRSYLENGTHIGYTQIQQHVRTRSDQ